MNLRLLSYHDKARAICDERQNVNRVIKTSATALVALLALGLGATPVQAGGAHMRSDQRALLQQLGVNGFDGIVVDSAMTYEQAMGDNVVPERGRALHAVMKPHMQIVPVAYWGLGADGQPDNKIHVGQIVVHKLLVADTIRVFAKMFQLRFPIHTVIPHSHFGYDDTVAMAANNTSNYRPYPRSEHGRGSAFDINPVQNPFDLSAYDGRPAEPAGAVYNPSAPGTFLMDSELRRYWSSLDWEWGGNWGNPNADPPIDFFRPGYYDYQHFQLNINRYDSFKVQLPPCAQDWTC